MGSRRTQLTGDVDALVVAYVSGIGLTAAAEAAGMSKQTAWRRLQTDEVRQLIADTKAAHRASVLDWALAVRSLADLVTDAVVTVLDCDPTPNTVCRLAATALPEVRHLAETVELGERLGALESQLGSDGTDDLARVVAIG